MKNNCLIHSQNVFKCHFSPEKRVYKTKDVVGGAVVAATRKTVCVLEFMQRTAFDLDKVFH